MTDSEFERLLRNWARWARERPHYISHCLSIEWRWDSRMWHGTYGDMESPPAPGSRTDPDVAEAMLVERAIRSPGRRGGWAFPERFRRVIVGRYVYRERPGAIVRRARIDHRNFQDVLQQARSALRNRLNFLMSRGKR